MRILYVISSLRIGGAEQQLIVTARAMIRRGHQVLIYTLNDLVPRAPALAGTGIGLRVDQKHRRIDMAVLRRLRATIREWGADVVHGMLYDGNIYAALAGWHTGAAVVASELSSGDRLSRLQRAGYLLTRGRYRALFANSQVGLERVSRLLRAPQRRCIVNGIDLDEVGRRRAAARAVEVARRPFAAASGVRTIAVVGTLSPVKDPVLALQVLRALSQRSSSPWRLLFVGGAAPTDEGRAFRDEVVRRAQRSFPPEMVVFTDYRDDALELIACSDVLLSTSHREGFPNVVLEAMAAGTPVVSTDYTDIRRILPFDWQVIGTRDPALFAPSIERAIAQSEQVCAAQYAWVEANATVERMADGFEALYASSLETLGAGG